MKVTKEEEARRGAKKKKECTFIVLQQEGGSGKVEGKKRCSECEYRCCRALSRLIPSPV